MIRVRQSARIVAVLVALVAPCGPPLAAHAGPPFPLISDRIVDAYRISLWVDPDATDDGSAAGQFWVMIQLADGSAVPAGTGAVVTIAPSDRAGERRSGSTAPVDGEAGRQFAALVMDHEGPFAVETKVSGPRGTAVVHAQVDATYDLRPPRAMIALYLLPFLLVGLLWSKLLIARGGGRDRRKRISKTEQRS